MGSGQRLGPHCLLSPLRRPQELLPAPSFLGPGTTLSWALGGSRAPVPLHLCPQPGAAPCQVQACVGACSGCEPSPGIFPPNKHS